MLFSPLVARWERGLPFPAKLRPGSCLKQAVLWRLGLAGWRCVTWSAYSSRGGLVECFRWVPSAGVFFLSKCSLPFPGMQLLASGLSGAEGVAPAAD